MSIFSQRFSSFWLSVHPIFKGTFFLFVSFELAKKALPQLTEVHNAGAAIWFGLVSLVFMAFGFHAFFFGKDNLVDTEFDEDLELQEARA